MFRLFKRKKLPILEDEIVWITAKCSEPGCETVGRYPTANPFESASRAHFCLVHNKTIAFSMGIVSEIH